MAQTSVVEMKQPIREVSSVPRPPVSKQCEVFTVPVPGDLSILQQCLQRRNVGVQMGALLLDQAGSILPETRFEDEPHQEGGGSYSFEAPSLRARPAQMAIFSPPFTLRRPVMDIYSCQTGRAQAVRSSES